MTEPWKKLNWKDHRPALVLRAPESLASQLESLQSETPVHAQAQVGQAYPFVLAFVPMCADFEALVPRLLPSVAPGAVLWFAYPKQTSKRMRSDLNRDKLAALAGTFGLEPVRNVAIDDDWSALRFKPLP